MTSVPALGLTRFACTKGAGHIGDIGYKVPGLAHRAEHVEGEELPRGVDVHKVGEGIVLQQVEPCGVGKRDKDAADGRGVLG